MLVRSRFQTNAGRWGGGDGAPARSYQPLIAPIITPRT